MKSETNSSFQNKFTKKTIWFINDYAGSKYHGMEFRNYYIARELVKNGHKIYIISASYMHLFRKSPEISGNYTFEDIDGINYIWIKVPKYRNSFDRKRVLKWFVFVVKLYFLPLKKLYKPDYIVASPMAPFLIFPSKYFSKKLSAKLIFEVKDLWPLSIMEMGNYSRFNPLIMLMQWSVNYAYKLSDLTVSVLSNSFEYMHLHGLTKDKFEYIPNGICTDDLAQSKELDSIYERQLPKNKFIIGYCGTVGISNALDSFVIAAQFTSDNPDINFVIVGDGMEKEHLKDISEKLGLVNITFVDAIPKEQVNSMLGYFDVCYIGLQKKKIFEYGVSPNKLYEYMYAAKPILYAINDKKNIVEKSNCGITVSSEDPEQIANGVLKFYRMSESQRNELGINAKKYVLGNHTYEEISKTLLEKFEKI